ncbi:MAG: 30S ribosomal protein S8 [Bacteroidia bacterium]|nr:30S ribosomal protein S8 [Bacteroidia bacterium]
MTDTIADLLTRIRNASAARHRFLEVPYSNYKLNIVKVLHEMGYLANYKVVEAKPVNQIKIALKYDPTTKQPAITKIVRVSKPGLRKYAAVDELPRVLNGLGIAIISTNKGVMTDKQARSLNVGGEVICYVY